MGSSNGYVIEDNRTSMVDKTIDANDGYTRMLRVCRVLATTGEIAVAFGQWSLRCQIQ